MKGVLIVDMINEFVDGKFGSRRARGIVGNIRRLCEKAEKAGVPVFFLRDAHEEGDPELKVWGRHAMAGTPASELVEELKPFAGKRVFPKRQFSGFLNTKLEASLKAEGVDDLYFAGISADICVQHNVADAFYRGYGLHVISDCVESIDKRKKESALKYMKTVYGASILSLKRVKF
ncbi:MAG: isochorismatase family cysteine hydrolase [Methanomassiliicoccales archaeon]